jgi:hypothetical protein
MAEEVRVRALRVWRRILDLSTANVNDFADGTQPKKSRKQIAGSGTGLAACYLLPAVCSIVISIGMLSPIEAKRIQRSPHGRNAARRPVCARRFRTFQ